MLPVCRLEADVPVTVSEATLLQPPPFYEIKFMSEVGFYAHVLEAAVHPGNPPSPGASFHVLVKIHPFLGLTDSIFNCSTTIITVDTYIEKEGLIEK